MMRTLSTFTGIHPVHEIQKNKTITHRAPPRAIFIWVDNFFSRIWDRW
jgi:hypothetical protein